MPKKSRKDPAVESIQQLLTAMEELLGALKAQQEMITMMARYMDVMSETQLKQTKLLEEIGKDVMNLHAKP